MNRKLRAAATIAVSVIGGSAALPIEKSYAQNSVDGIGTAQRFLPEIENLGRPEERVILNATLQKVVAAKTPSAALLPLDEALSKLSQPTPLRGMLQLWRSTALLSDNRTPEAIDAIEESIRLLPQYSAPLIAAASLYAYANDPKRGADYFLRAISVDPESARNVEDYEIGNLVRRLKFLGDQRRIDALSDRLLQIGWVGTTLELRSSLVRGAISRRVRAGDVAGARTLISKLIIPKDSYRLLVNNEMKNVWPDLEQWAGPALHTQWEIYVREARERWLASKDSDALQDYVRALAAAGLDDALIRDVMPLFSGSPDKILDQDFQFAITQVASALARKGRWQDIEQMFAHAQEIWPLSKDNPNALNITANWARFLLYEGKYGAALDKFDIALDLSKKWDVNPDAVAAIHRYRACTLHALHRDDDAGVSVEIAASMSRADEIAEVHLCMGDDSAALQSLIGGLASEVSREEVLLFAQKDTVLPPASEYGHRMSAAQDRLRNDPEFIAEVTRFGRILPFSLTDGAPSGR